MIWLKPFFAALTHLIINVFRAGIAMISFSGDNFVNRIVKVAAPMIYRAFLLFVFSVCLLEYAYSIFLVTRDKAFNSFNPNIEEGVL